MATIDLSDGAVEVTFIAIAIPQTPVSIYNRTSIHVSDTVATHVVFLFFFYSALVGDTYVDVLNRVK